MPESRRIVVRGAIRGTRVCDLVVSSSDDGDEYCGGGVDDDGPIRSIALAWLPYLRSGRGRRKRDGVTNVDDHDSDYDDDDGTGMANDGEGEWTILAGCAGGIVREWSVSSLSSTSMSTSSSPPSTTRLLPRRSFRLTCKSTKVRDVNHLASPSYSSYEDDRCASSSSSSDAPAIVYGLIDGEGTAGGASSWLVRFVVPPFVATSNVSTGGGGVGVVSGNKKSAPRPLPARKLTIANGKDRAFGLLAAYRPRSSHRVVVANDNDDGGGGDGDGGDAFVVMCAPRSIVVYRDRHDDGDDDRDDVTSSPHRRLVKFDESSTGGGTLTCAVISPGAKDLALGRARGHVDVLHGVFENASRYLDDVHISPPRDGVESNVRRHPSKTTVRRTLHWHSHPVRALAYATAGLSSSSGSGSGGRRKRGGSSSSTAAANDMSSLLSGAEESVLVTWQLERNYHRPSNFISRVGRGGIVSILRCGRTGGVIVFCSDNTIQRFDGVTHDRVWVERGLASMELHEEEEEEEEEGGGGGGEENAPGGSGVADGIRRRLAARRGPILMVRDPITNHPMLTNLPGAPGMVHWYDPTSASVIGTLEVRTSVHQTVH